MKKRNFLLCKNMVKLISILVLIECINFYPVFGCCGNDIIPYTYVPGQAGTYKNANNRFFIMNKGVISGMFNSKKLQPLFRNIMLLVPYKLPGALKGIFLLFLPLGGHKWHKVPAYLVENNLVKVLIRNLIIIPVHLG